MTAENYAQKDAIQPWLRGRSFADYLAELNEVGYVIFPEVLSPTEIAETRGALQSFLDADVTGRNNFEGLKSNRVYGMMAKSPTFVNLCIHPLALAFAEAELGGSCLLSACLAINLQPGESAQPWHQDDSHCRLPMPRPAHGVSTFWALDPMTEDNGATELIPASHKWGEEEPKGSNSAADFANTEIRDPSLDTAAHHDAIKATMPAGSFMVTKGNLWHRGGANLSDAARLIVTPQYCPGWMRQLENMLLVVPPETAITLPKRAQELLGYSIHPPFMGYVDGMHPARALSVEPQ